jgi:nucleoside-diphosphate-sugar epimerase
LGGENITYDEFLEVVTGIIGKLNIIKLPLYVMKMAGAVELIKARLTGSFPAFTPRMLDRYFITSTFTCAKAKADLGYQVTPFKTGIENTINYLKKEML